jgi:glutamate/tyrosine decarboxylase-like PLP-dependent enzyme
MIPTLPGTGVPPPLALDPPPDTIRAMAAEAIAWVVRYHESIRERAVFPRTSAAGLQERLGEPLPQEGRGFTALLDTFRDVVVANARHNAHPRSLGYVSSPGTAVAALADLLASVLNANLTAWRSGPGPAQLERVSIDWVRQAMGCSEGTDGVFVSGGSMANLAGLAAARASRCGQAVNAEGQRAHPKPLRVYVSEEGHHSVDKAAALLGIGHANVRRIAVDERFRMDVADLERRIADDRDAGAEPLCIVASAGTVVTGAVDPLADVAAVARREGLALHVDACYGGFARLAPSARRLFDGIADADSIALDPHKWLYLPVDCGCILYRDPAAARAAFVLGADYTRVLETAPGEAFAFWDYTPELSRRFRALKVWMALAHVGARAYGEAIESNLDCAAHLGSLVEESEDLELLAPVGLSIVCFRWLPPGFRTRGPRTPGEEAHLDSVNERVLVALQRGGGSYLSNATVRGRFGLRGCVLNFRTTRDDMRALLDDVRRAAVEAAV